MDVIESCNPKARRIAVDGDHFANVRDASGFNAALLTCLD